MLSWQTLAGYALGIASIVVAALLLKGEAQSTVIGAGTFLMGWVTKGPGAK